MSYKLITLLTTLLKVLHNNNNKQHNNVLVNKNLFFFCLDENSSSQTKQSQSVCENCDTSIFEHKITCVCLFIHVLRELV